MLKDSRLVRGVEARIGKRKINAESAVATEVAELVEKFHAMDDPYLAARGAEIRELGNRLLRNLAAALHPLETGVPAGSIIIAAELTPADAALLDPRTVAGIATETGGAEGHTAIMARALELPTVLGAEKLTEKVQHGATIIVDGDKGLILTDPTPRQVSEYRAAKSSSAKTIGGSAN